MKIQLLLVGKTRFPFIREGMEEYRRRVVHYADFTIRELPDLKKPGSRPEKMVKLEEGIGILRSIDKADYVVLLDERGQASNSLEFAAFLEKRQHGSYKTLVFVIGGAYGFSEEVYQRADLALSLSKMTFSHEMIRLIFLEQLYRAFSIIRGEPYHHG